MSKELEIMKDTKYRLKELGYDENVLAECDLVIKALQRLESIDDSKPSEALECVNWLDATIPQWCREKSKELPDTIKPIKQALIKAENDKKELEEYRIIKRALGHCIYDKDGTAWYIEHYYSEYGLKQLHSVRKFGTIIDMKFNLSDYKITWWFKKDKSE